MGRAPRWRCCTSAGAVSSPASPRPRCASSAKGRSTPLSAPGSGPAAMRWGRRSLLPSESATARRCSTAGISTCTRRPRRRSTRRAARASSGSRCAPRATRTSSSHTAATDPGRAGRGSLLASAEDVRARYEQLREEVGPGVTVVAATKYVSLEDMAVLAEAGVEVVGENRAQDLERKHAVYGAAFRWHFIGHLQSNKAKVVNGICELVHSLGSESAAARLTVPALVEVNLSGEASKSGVSPEQLPGLLRAYGDVRGLMTMPPAAPDPEDSRPFFRRLRALAAEHDLTELSMGTSQDYRVAAEEGATLVRVGSVLYGP